MRPLTMAWVWGPEERRQPTLSDRHRPGAAAIGADVRASHRAAVALSVIGVVVAALATAAGIAVHNADLFEEGRLRQQWLEASAEIRNELLAGASEEDALRLIAQRAQELTRSDVTVIALGSGEQAGVSPCAPSAVRWNPVRRG